MARRNPAVRRTKEEVAGAALALFCDRGYHSVTVDDIAAAAGVTKGAFYYYFADKEDLAKDLWHELWTRLAERAESAFDPQADVASNLKGCFRALLEALSGLGEARFFLRDAWVLPAVEVAGREDQEAAVKLFGSLLEDAKAAGGLAGLEVEAVSRVLLGAYAEGVLHILTTGDPEPTLAVLDTVVDAVLSGQAGSRAGSGVRQGVPPGQACAKDAHAREGSAGEGSVREGSARRALSEHQRGPTRRRRAATGVQP